MKAGVHEALMTAERQVSGRDRLSSAGAVDVTMAVPSTSAGRDSKRRDEAPLCVTGVRAAP